MSKKATAAPEKAEAYLVRFPDAPGLNGYQRMINFVGGEGVLDRQAVAEARRDLVDPQTLKVLAKWDVLGENAKYWADRGAKVEAVTEAAAKAFRSKLGKAPSAPVKEVPKPAAAKKASKKGTKPPHQREG